MSLPVPEQKEISQNYLPCSAPRVLLAILPSKFHAWGFEPKSPQLQSNTVTPITTMAIYDCCFFHCRKKPWQKIELSNWNGMFTKFRSFPILILFLLFSWGWLPRAQLFKQTIHWEISWTWGECSFIFYRWFLSSVDNVLFRPLDMGKSWHS